MPRTLNKLVDEALLKLGAKHKNLMVLNPVFSPGSKMEFFAKNYEDRYVAAGLSVESSIAAACGMTVRGKIPFVCADAAFLIASAYKQIRDMVAFPNLNVKLIGLNAGVGLARQGFGYQAVDDLALTLPLPNLKIFSPADNQEMEAVLAETAQIFGPVYVRFSFEEDTEIFKKSRFTEGHVEVLRKGSDVTVFTYGGITETILQVADKLAQDDIRLMVVNVPSLRPLNAKALLKCASETKFSVVVEDHFVNGGLGTMLAKLLAEKYPTRLFVLGFDNFTDSDEKNRLFKKSALDVEGICKKLKSLIKLV